MKDKLQQDKGKAAETAKDTGSATTAQVDELPAQLPITPEQLQDLKDRASKAEEYWDRLLRQAADFENYKKRATRERQDAVKYANESLLEKLIPILDTFEMAITAAATAETAKGAQSLQTGVSMIFNQLKSVLGDAGLEEINALNTPFDPNWHEAVAQKEAADVPEGQVVQQLRKGYKLKDRLIRPATVIVAKQPGS